MTRDEECEVLRALVLLLDSIELSGLKLLGDDPEELVRLRESMEAMLAARR